MGGGSVEGALSVHRPHHRQPLERGPLSMQLIVRLTVLGSALSPDFVTDGRSLIFGGKPGRGNTHLYLVYPKSCYIRPALHPVQRRCSSLKYAQYSRSSRLAGRAHRGPRC